MRFVLYFCLTLLATTAGSMTGMGGGVIIKPGLDMLGHYDVETIGILSSVTVLTMSLVTIARQAAQKTEIPYRIALPLAAGSAVGGLLGQRLLRIAVGSFEGSSQVTVVQNIALCCLIAAVFYYMSRQDNIKSLGWSGALPSLAAGLFLGIISSFLGIGGGPINVALMMFVFSMELKTATVCSILTILFSQGTKLATVALSTGFQHYDLSMLPFMILAAMLGGMLGSTWSKRLSERAVKRCFHAMQIIILAIALMNIIKNI